MLFSLSTVALSHNIAKACLGAAKMEAALMVSWSLATELPKDWAEPMEIEVEGERSWQHGYLSDSPVRSYSNRKLVYLY